MDISYIRENYSQLGIRKRDLNKDPIEQFKQWFKQAQNAKLAEPNAMSLATISETHEPSIRVVLLKYFDQHGFVFFTNYTSNKAQDIQNNPHVAVSFPWLILEKQVIIKGVAKKIPIEDSKKYFLSRPYSSQLGAWVSHQSKKIETRNSLEKKLENLKKTYYEISIPYPEFWGGYIIVPNSFEFWQGRKNRLHDRFKYEKKQNKEWEISRLSP